MQLARAEAITPGPPKTACSAKKAVLFGRRQDLLGVSLTYQPNQEIYGEGEPAKRFYRVLRGVVRTHLLLDDGRRQVAGFCFEGGIFGLELVENYGTSSEVTSRPSGVTGSSRLHHSRSKLRGNYRLAPPPISTMLNAICYYSAARRR
jgi:Cyclic nucleotide-binding domain